MTGLRSIPLVVAALGLVGCPVAVTDTYTLEPEAQGGAGPDCNDRRQNGDETDIDCGGSDCAACEMGRACVAARDCVSGSCQAEVCD